MMMMRRGGEEEEEEEEDKEKKKLIEGHVATTDTILTMKGCSRRLSWSLSGEYGSVSVSQVKSGHQHRSLIPCALSGEGVGGAVSGGEGGPGFRCALQTETSRNCKVTASEFILLFPWCLPGAQPGLLQFQQRANN
ncbi:hypothetical protein C0Q70_12421 [Pomacea canaliculata]|uniref:Uncharacterized protein n=1 Tax=Pomacea canaliculata TaxID=400727 RepID=A0A2T7P1I1_POMCA|nr:hypothetical protein C0Q70_12421 [Pomacea canaliculata]